MGNTRELKKRIKAIKSIRRITKTMQMIATSKFARSQQRATQSKPYTEGIFDLVTELAEKAGNISHPLIDGPRDGFKPTAKPLVLVLTSDRGLCGPYNGSILRAAMKHLRSLNDYALEVVGRKGQSVLKFNKFAIGATHNQFGDKHALFTAAVERECEKMRGHFSLEHMPPGTIRERLTAIGEAIFAFLFRPEMIQFERRIAAETEHDPALGAAFLVAGPWRMKQGFSAWLSHAAAAGELVIGDPDLAAEQFVSMCKGMGDLERRFGAEVTPDNRDRRIAGAVEVFLAAYGAGSHR
jgi:TetR/AcrR family transcriptional repressor of mexJK operon